MNVSLLGSARTMAPVRGLEVANSARQEDTVRAVGGLPSAKTVSVDTLLAAGSKAARAGENVALAR